jgi:hypothetical protein
MVNRMIKPRSAFFSQMPASKETTNSSVPAAPAAAAWPAVISGAPAGAGREKPSTNPSSSPRYSMDSQPSPGPTPLKVRQVPHVVPGGASG